MMKFKKSALILGVSLSALIALPAFAQEQTSSEGTVTVLGSRIKRINKEGPAPVTVIDDKAIQAGGYASIPDVLKSVTQNGGETLSQQSYGGNIMTPGAAQVDLRGLGPNHTLVLMNGRRIADFPMPFNGVSNFTDVSNIPVSMVKSVEVLSGSASAIYGSDAVSGVVNFNLKEKVDGTEVSLRYGDTELGGGESYKATLSTGYSSDKFSVAFGAEYINKKPIWQYQRDWQDSRLDAPLEKKQRPDYLFLLYYMNEYQVPYGWVPGGSDTCDALSSYAGGTVQYSEDYWADPYCGSLSTVSIGTITNKQEGLSTFTTFRYDLSDGTKLFADLSLGFSKTSLVNDMTTFNLQNEWGQSISFWNNNTGEAEEWSRYFTVEEAGGLNAFTTTNKSTSFSFVPGFKKQIGGFNVEAALNIAGYYSEIKLPEIIAAKATAHYLGTQLGTTTATFLDDDDNPYDVVLPVYDADPTKLFTALTPAQYASMAEFATTKANSYNTEFSLVANKPDLFELPAGPVGVAFVAELGKQGYEVNPNANATDFGYYVGYAATSGSGSRNHEALGAEFKVPLHDMLDFSFATRYDAFQFAGQSVSKPTFNTGIEFRPFKQLLLRSSYGTGFRAPDLHYVFAKKDLYHPTASDYLACRNNGITDAASCDDSKYNDTILKIREGSSSLKPETSKSFNAGAVWQPTRNLFVSVDYFNIDMRNQVEDMKMSQVLLNEAACTLGTTFSGTTVNPSSSACVDAISRVHRDSNGKITYVYINPINVAQEKTDGLDIQASLDVPTNFGKFKFGLGHTEVFNHTKKQYADEASKDLLVLGSPDSIPSQKTNASISFERDKYSITLTGNRLGKIQNYNSYYYEVNDEDSKYLKPYYIYNLNFQYDLTEATNLSLTVNNVANKKPIFDNTQSNYPWYNSSWYDPTGRAYFVEIKHKF